MIEVRSFNGKLNLDDNPYRLPKGDYVDALNITRDAQGDGQDEVVSNIVGNQKAIYFGATISSEAVGTTTTDTLSFYGYPIDGTYISIYISGGTFVATYFSKQGDSIQDVLLGLETYYLAHTQPSLSVNISGNDFQVIYNNTIYLAGVTFTINNSIYDGVNKVIGNFADRVKNRIYYFVWNDGDFHQILYIDLTDRIVYPVMVNLIDTDNVNVLNFDPSYRINHIDIIYRDEGDLLFWTDGLNPPRKINIETATTGAYGVIINSYLDVAKEPPSTPPLCAYENDNTVIVNNLSLKQFKFKYRFVYDDLEKSVTSAQSAMCIPKEYTSQSVITNPTLNAKIAVLIQTGAENVKKIEILGSESLGATWSDFSLITVLDKQVSQIQSNTTFVYYFYNNEAYSLIPLEESIQPFDAVPQKAYTQSLLNGNILDYGAIAEGYDLVNSNYSVFSSGYLSSTNLYNYTIGSATQYPSTTDPTIKIEIYGLPKLNDNYIFQFSINGGSAFGLSSSCTVADSAPSMITSLISNCTTNGLTVTSINANSFLVKKIGGSLSIAGYPYPLVYNNSRFQYQTQASEPAYDWYSKYSYGVVYFDEKGRTNGVTQNINASFQTNIYAESLPIGNSYYVPFVPQVDFFIKSLPPSWATYFEIVRTKNLTKSNFLYWLSESTYKDIFPTGQGYKYAYIAIPTLDQYIIDNPEAKAIGYEFTPGDRIRFVKLIDASGTTVQVYPNKDFEIITTLTNPTINGKTINGTVLKIYLPTTDSTFDFGTPTFNNYFIEIYTPTATFSNQTNLYYEFGKKYNIANAGTPNAYHEGDQNQDPLNPITHPAIFGTLYGDSYFRYRYYPTKGGMRFKGGTGNWGQGGSLGWQLIDNFNNNPAYTPQNSAAHAYDPYSYPTQLPYAILVINDHSQPLTFTLTGTLTFTPLVTTASTYISLIGGPNGSTNPPFGLQIYWNQSITLQANVQVAVPLNITFTIPANPNIIYLAIEGLTNNSGGNWQPGLVINEFDFIISQNKPILQGVIDPSFSDNVASSATLNGRAWAYNPNTLQEYNPVLIRHGGEYQAGTNVNNINRFYEDNFDVYDRSRGAIKKMFIEGRNQYIFQEFDVGVVTVLTQIVRDTAGNPLSAESDKLLNKIVYPYIGQYGIGDVPESFAYGKRAKYFVDNNKGVVCRLSTDGITPISILYKTNAFFVPKLNAFKKVLSQAPPATGYPTVYGAYDAYTNKYIIAMDQLLDGVTEIQPAYTFVFLDSRDSKEGFECQVDFHPENIGDVNNLLVSFLEGIAWIHDNPVHCNFYGNQYGSSITTCFNDQALDRKSYLSIMQTSNTIWYCSDIKSQVDTYGSTPQTSNINVAWFKLLEGQYSAAILRDVNSPGGLLNGQNMKGNYLIVKFQKDAASEFYYINTVSLKYNNSPLNTR